MNLNGKKKIVSSDEVKNMEAALDGQGWLSADNLCTALFIGRTESGRRHIRAIAEAGGARFISGQSGYKLTKQATPEEISHAIAWLRAQATKMLQRAAQIEVFLQEHHGLIRRQRDDSKQFSFKF